MKGGEGKMFFKNKLVFALVLVVVVVGGITLLVKPMDVFGNKANKIVVDDHSFTNIEVLANNATVEIVPSKNSEVTVAYSGETKKKTKYIFKADVKGDTLSVQFEEKRRGFIHFGMSFKDLTLTVSIPEKQYNRIQVETENGRIVAGNIQAEDISLETDNGAIELKHIDATAISVKTDNGKILLEDVEGKIKGRTDNGQVSLVTKNLDQSIELSTDNGRIEIQTEKEPTNATIDAKTDNGRVEIFGQETKNVTFGKGKHLIKLRTDNGRITVTK